MNEAAESLREAPKEKSGWVSFIDLLITLDIACALIYVYLKNTNLILKITVGLIVLICAAGYLLKKRALSGASSSGSSTGFAQPDRVEAQAPAGSEVISKLTLLDDDGQKLKEWYIQGETSLLIGKSSSQSEVEIDLSDVEYASLVSKEHAVLNYASGCWYIEDLDSSNGVGIKKRSGGPKQGLEPDAPYPLHSGDTIYIANTRLLVK